MSEYDRPDAYYRFQEADDRELAEIDEITIREPDENQVDAICILLETLAMSGQFRKLAEGMVMDGITEARLIECYRSATDPAVFSEVMKFIA